MLERIVQHFEAKVKEKEAEWVARLKEDFCYEAVEREVLGLTRELFSEVMEEVLKEVLEDREVLEALKRFGGKLAVRFVSYQEVEVTVGNGRKVKVRSPYFVKAGSKRGKPKRGPNGRGCHLWLEGLGFLGRCSSMFVDEVVKMALLCPSFSVAHEVLSSRGMEVGASGDDFVGVGGGGIREDGGDRDRWWPASDTEEEAGTESGGFEAERV
jgi:hypothetical protein